MFSALIVGSMAPDFHYFFHPGPHGHFSHSIRGAFIVCLPSALAVLWVYQTVMKVPLIQLAPERHQQKLVALATPFRWGPASRFALIVLSLLVGIATHILWDSLTHERGVIVRNFPDLREPPFDQFGSERPLYNILQHTSTVIGITILAVWYWGWYRRTPGQSVPRHLQTSPRFKIWFTATLLAVSAAASTTFAYVVSIGLHPRLRFFLGVSVIDFMSLVLVGALGYSVWWQWRNRRDARNPIPVAETAQPDDPAHRA